MTKSIRHILLFLILACLVSACRKDTGINGSEENDVILNLSFRMSDAAPGTKTTVPGDDSRNENVISWVDLFFFRGDGGTGTERHRSDYQAEHPVQDATDPSLYTLKYAITKDQLDAIFGTTDPGVGNTRTAKLAVVGNGDAVSEGGYMLYPDAETSSVQAVRESLAKTNFDLYADLWYLICCGSGEISFTHTASPDALSLTGTIPMTRAYAKLDVALGLPPLGQLEWAGRTYTADLDHMTVELLNVVNRGYAGSDDDHIRTVTEDDLIPTTGTRAFTVGSSEPPVATHNCFYSYPRRLTDVSDQEMEYRIAIPWQGPDPGDPVHVGYYRIPAVDEDEVDVILANHYYHTESLIRTLGAADPNAAETLEGSFAVLTEWGAAPVFGLFNDYEYLVALPKWVTMAGVTSGTAEYMSSSALTGCTITNIRTYWYQGTGAELAVDSGSSDPHAVPVNSPAYSVTYDGNTVTLRHELELNGDPMYYRQEITVTLTNEEGLTESLVFEQLSSLDLRSTGHQGTTGNFFINGLKIGEGTWLAAAYNYSKPPASASTATALRYNMRVTVSSFTSDNDTYVYGDPAANPKVYHKYRIGDPRVSQSKWTAAQFNLSSGGNSTYQWNKDSELDRILIANPDASAADFIAPEFIFSSGLATALPIKRSELEMRAAMYQESGYPAGRWRLMTEAEFKYLADLQIRGVIPVLFIPDNTNAKYVTAQGTCYRIVGSSIVKESVGENDAVGARYVYDSWYWGPEPDPESLTTYHPQP